MSRSGTRTTKILYMDDGASILGQQSIRTRQIMLEFYPPVLLTSEFMSHD
jgi:hypothetical protein